MLANKLMGGSEEKLYVDDVFSTTLYTGNGSTQTINNGIDLAGEGGLVWFKSRNNVAQSNHLLTDTARTPHPTSGGVATLLRTNLTDAASSNSVGLSWKNNGFDINLSTNENWASWTFRKAPKFFDVVTYTGDGVAGRQIPHSLGIAPGMIVTKRVDAVSDWAVYHRSVGFDAFLLLNTTAAQSASTGYWGNEITSTYFEVANGSNHNTAGGTYVAYLFAHDTTADGIIQCGSFTTDASGNATVNLGWEPQYLLVKNSSSAGNWQQIDSMRGWTVDGSTSLVPNLADAESLVNSTWKLQSTGFSANGTTASATYIYLAIRRPNKPPTSGTEVYNAIARTGTGAAATVTGVGFAPDMLMVGDRQGTSNRNSEVFDKLRGTDTFLATAHTNAEFIGTGGVTGWLMDGVSVGDDLGAGGINKSAFTYVNHFFRRAPGFMDEVCDTGTAAAHAISHNLTKAPELLIRKSRSAATQWEVWHSTLAATEKLVLLSTAAKATDTTAWNSTVPTASQFTVGTGANVNASAATFVTYLFASLSGISKVGSYTGNGSSQTINCGFTTGARFILIKRTDSTGDWYVWDTVRGIVAANDPYLSLNTTVAEVTTDDSVDPESTGFIVNQNTATNINVNGGSYIFLAIA